jgi:diguanylate cyclase (GGDEF)-like protein
MESELIMDITPVSNKDLVLIVDDDPTLRMIARATLEKSGFRVEEAEDGEQALKKFIQHHPAVIMMDVEMPKLNGFEACKRIREDAVGAHIPILITTGLEDFDSINRAYSAGATDFLAKPINWQLIPHRIRYVLRASRTYQELRTTEAKNNALLNAMPDTLFVIRRNGDIVNFLAGNEAATLPEPRGDQLNIRQYFPDDIAQSWLESISKVMSDHTVQQFEFSLEQNDQKFHYELQMVPYLNDLTLAIVREITDRKRTEEKIQQLAYFDTLTGLPNRQLFLQHLTTAIEHAKQEGTKIAALYIDLDNFKRINDTLGHTFGDAVLKTIAERLDHCIRSDDCVTRAEVDQPGMHLARLGGDEFVAILREIENVEDAVAVADRIRDQLTQPVEHLGQEFVVTTSIGVSVYPNDGDDRDTLLKNADIAMYQAKNAGRNSVRFYSGTMSLRSLERLELENELRYAIQRNQLDLHYQPKINLETDELVGVEALLRWQHPERGNIPPAKFIPLAEECGLISSLGEWVLHKACQQVKQWQDRYLRNITMAVNVSSQQFYNSNMADIVLKELFDTGLSPSSLQLELTETILMNDVNDTISTLTKLQKAGTSLAMDDFGTGYSSLSYLNRLPIDTLKIDRSFVMGLESIQENAAICSAIIAMGHALGMVVVAEGVETESQKKFLQDQNCDQIQGYLISKPLPAEALENAFLTSAKNTTLIPNV